jgi:hypothetical protein
MPALFGPLERTSHNQWTSDPTEQASPSSHLGTEADPISETLFFLVVRTPDDG